MKIASHEKTLLCPSAPYASKDKQVFGLVVGSPKQPRVLYLKQAIAEDSDTLESLEKVLHPAKPEQMFRAAAPCMQAKCLHYEKDHDKCGLVERIVDVLPPAVEALAPCSIRKQCVWWFQSGAEACLRCPQIATFRYEMDALTFNVAKPNGEKK